MRYQRDLVVLILHLSRLVPPAPRPHHIRIARVLLQDTATRHGGQVFALRNQDLVLVAQTGVAIDGNSENMAGSLVVHPPKVLPSTLACLFSADVSSECQLTSLHQFGEPPAALLDYLAGCAASPPSAASPTQLHNPVLSLAALKATLDHAPLAELLILRTGMRLRADGQLSLAERFVPVFRCLQFSLSTLNLNPVVTEAMSDPFLYRHLAAGLDDRLISLLSDDIANDGALTRQAAKAGMAVHIELGLASVLSPNYARLARQATDAGLRIGVALPLMNVCEDFDRLEQARRFLSMTGGELVITQFRPNQMKLARPASLNPSLVKLTWSTSLMDDGQVRQADRLCQLDPSRIVLHDVDSWHAVAWGRAHGITLYEGAFMDHVQAARRMTACRHAAECTIGDCCDRARAAGAWGRVGCRSKALLGGSLAASRTMERAT